MIGYRNNCNSLRHVFLQTMCSESDLKDLGLPMGPRKKLQGILKEEQQKKVTYIKSFI